MGWSRKSNLGRMASRERRAYPYGSVRSEQRRQTPESALAIRVASLFGLNYVAPRSQIHSDMLPRRALFKPKIQQPRGQLLFMRWLLGVFSP